MDNETKYIAVLDKMYSTYHTKNADYGNAFEKSLDKYGPVAGLTRMSDKMGRIENLLLRPKDETQVPDEKISDTLMDLANYAVMMVMYYCDVAAINPGFGDYSKESLYCNGELVEEKEENIDKTEDINLVRNVVIQKLSDDFTTIRSNFN